MPTIKPFTQQPTTAERRSRAKAALQTFFVGDSLSMPVHWFYQPAEILKAFPDGIRTLYDAPEHHPSSIMSLHSTRAGGRSSKKSTNSQEIVGDVILKGKRQYWGVSNQHYHRGMAAGDNTLNLCCARLLIRGLIKQKMYNPDHFLQDYIEFMTADEPRHPDTYAESYHRAFFANHSSGKPPSQCAGVTHDTPSIGGLITLAPLAILELLCGRDVEQVKNTCRKHLFCTHPDETLALVSDSFVTLMHELLFRDSNTDALPMIYKAGRSLPGVNIEKLTVNAISDLQVIGGKYSSACYITDSWPGVLYLAAKYPTDIPTALEANALVGGDNAHRGAILGCILGLMNAQTNDSLFNQLLHSDAISTEVDQLLDLTLDTPAR